MWSKPWSYKEGLIIGAGLLVIGALLQITVGGINWNLFAWPVNLIVLSVYIIVLIAMHLLRKRVYLFGWLSHYSAAVSSLVWVVGMTVAMGLIRQAPSGHASNDILGFSQMISSWSFVLLYLWMATALGLTILRTSFPLKFGRLSFLLNHIGLFIALIAATLGNADMQRLKMTTRMGNAEWRATDDKGQLTELPLAIELKDFTIDEYMIYQAKVLGASAILLICSLLSQEQIKEYLEISRELGLSALTEAHSEKEVEKALCAGANIVGVNNRNLKDFSVNPENCRNLRQMVPGDILFVSESGIQNAKDVAAIRKIGADALLIGEAFMKARDKKTLLFELRGSL